MANIKKGKISDLVPDLKNINKGSEFGNHLLEKSLRESGAGRSIVVDKNMNVLAGNKTLEKAGELGFENTLIVQTTGRDLVVVQRTDLDINSEAGVKYKILDNTVSKHNYVEDIEVMEAVIDEYKIVPEEYGLPNNTQTFSNKNRSLDLLEFEEKIEFVLKLTSEQFFILQEKFSLIKQKEKLNSNEEVLIKILELYV